LEDARVLAREKRWNACVNRLYYACFYAVSALLVCDGLSSSKHSGIRGLFNKQYVKTGQIPKGIARIYNDLFERRQESDYIIWILSIFKNHRFYHGFQKQKISSNTLLNL
jgi:uncharacterized protein (UPF0332 family)